MTTQIKALDAVHLRDEKNEVLDIENVHSAQPLPDRSIPLHQLQSEIWVGYSSGDQHIVDKVSLPGNSETKMISLRYWWETQILVLTRLVYYYVFCLRPAIFVGTLPYVGVVTHEFRFMLTLIDLAEEDWQSNLPSRDAIYHSREKRAADSWLLQPTITFRPYRTLRS